MVDELMLQGKAGTPIWAMADGTGEHIIGLRLNHGDSGAVYLTAEQAKEVISHLTSLLTQLEAERERKHAALYLALLNNSDSEGMADRDAYALGLELRNKFFPTSFSHIFDERMLNWLNSKGK